MRDTNEAGGAVFSGLGNTTSGEVGVNDVQTDLDPEGSPIYEMTPVASIKPEQSSMEKQESTLTKNFDGQKIKVSRGKSSNYHTQKNRMSLNTAFKTQNPRHGQNQTGLTVQPANQTRVDNKIIYSRPFFNQRNVTSTENFRQTSYNVNSSTRLPQQRNTNSSHESINRAREFSR